MKQLLLHRYRGCHTEYRVIGTGAQRKKKRHEKEAAHIYPRCPRASMGPEFKNNSERGK